MINADDIESHVCSTDEKKSKRVIINACYLDKSESKIFHISVTTIEVKNENNETKDE